jgi:hypothetical protein
MKMNCCNSTLYTARRFFGILKGDPSMAGIPCRSKEQYSAIKD